MVSAILYNVRIEIEINMKQIQIMSYKEGKETNTLSQLTVLNRQ